MMRKPDRRRQRKSRNCEETAKAPLAYFDDDDEPEPVAGIGYGRSLGRKIGKSIAK